MCQAKHNQHLFYHHTERTTRYELTPTLYPCSLVVLTCLKIVTTIRTPLTLKISFSIDLTYFTQQQTHFVSPFIWQGQEQIYSSLIESEQLLCTSLTHQAFILFPLCCTHCYSYNTNPCYIWRTHLYSSPLSTPTLSGSSFIS